MALTTNYVIEEADALKSQGSDAPGRVGAQSYGSANNRVVCGGVLCSEYPGGYEQYQKDQEQGVKLAEPVEPEPVEEETIEEPMKETMEEPMKETMMEETMEAEIAPGSVLRLSRANVPAVIPLHQGFYNGDSVYFIVTDSSDETHANVITESRVES